MYVAFMRVCGYTHRCFVFVCVSVCAYACVVEKLVYNVMARMLEYVSVRQSSQLCK